LWRSLVRHFCYSSQGESTKGHCRGTCREVHRYRHLACGQQGAAALPRSVGENKPTNRTRARLVSFSASTTGARGASVAAHVTWAALPPGPSRVPTPARCGVRHGCSFAKFHSQNEWNNDDTNAQTVIENGVKSYRSQAAHG
jgi:hypothetical protein